MRQIPLVLAAVAVLTQIAYPITSGSVNDAVTVAVVTLLAATAFVHAWITRGPRFLVTLVVAATGVGFAAEVVGVATGFPFGCYEYALDRLGPNLADVPLVVPLAWAGGSYPIWCAVSAATAAFARRSGHTRRAAIRIPVVAATIVGWDLYLDPQMVTAGYWTWCSEGPLLPGFDIPLTNYLGWALVGVIVATALEIAESSDTVPDGVRLRRDAAPLILFFWTWLGSFVAHAVFLAPQIEDADLRISAVYGLIGMSAAGVPLVMWCVRNWRFMSRKDRDMHGRRTHDGADLAR
ncbi:carotenoid biosynthesis protein [Hoyosella rhizosphaerae]|nr:carotenoid biosynthesis protein [Hoyosella rhizosphaerae]